MIETDFAPGASLCLILTTICLALMLPATVGQASRRNQRNYLETTSKKQH
jgi:hypothetical protein